MARMTVKGFDVALDHEQLPVVIVDDDDRIVHATPLAIDLLEQQTGHTCLPGTTLPEALQKTGRGRTHRGEQEVLALVAEGWTNGEVGQELAISVHTVRRHLEAIFRKLGVSTRSAATAAFLRRSPS